MKVYVVTADSLPVRVFANKEAAEALVQQMRTDALARHRAETVTPLVNWTSHEFDLHGHDDSAEEDDDDAPAPVVKTQKGPTLVKK